jgi:hypothetical protein
MGGLERALRVCIKEPHRKPEILVPALGGLPEGGFPVTVFCRHQRFRAAARRDAAKRPRPRKPLLSNSQYETPF